MIITCIENNQFVYNALTTALFESQLELFEYKIPSFWNKQLMNRIFTILTVNLLKDEKPESNQLR